MRDSHFRFACALIAVAAFALYWFSSAILHGRLATMHFGADSYLYVPFSQGRVTERVVRFHPLTAALAMAWMSLLKPLTAWIDSLDLLKAMSAALGALGVWAAISAFAVLLPRRLALIGGIIYALSFSVWYFSSIEESKILTATLTAAYIALYLRLREQWSVPGVAALTLILLAACLNEIVACFLVAIPFVDEFLKRGLDFRRLRWVAAHALVAPVALLFVEVVLGGRLAVESDPESASHFSMLFFYIARNDYSPAAVYSFVLNWFFFSIAAPAGLQGCLNCTGHFEPAVANYFLSPWRAGPVLLFSAMLAAMLVPKYRAGISAAARPALAGLAAYTLTRALFFFMFNSAEAMLYTPAVVLPHLMLLLVPFAASNVPAKHAWLGIFAVLLFIANGLFIMGA